MRKSNLDERIQCDKNDYVKNISPSHHYILPNHTYPENQYHIYRMHPVSKLPHDSCLYFGAKPTLTIQITTICLYGIEPKTLHCNIPFSILLSTTL